MRVVLGIILSPILAVLTVASVLTGCLTYIVNGEWDWNSALWWRIWRIQIR